MLQFFVLKLQLNEKCASSVCKTFKSQSLSPFICTKRKPNLPNSDVLLNQWVLVLAHVEIYMDISWEWSNEIITHVHKKFQFAMYQHVHCIQHVQTLSFVYRHSVPPSQLELLLGVPNFLDNPWMCPFFRNLKSWCNMSIKASWAATCNQPYRSVL